MSLTLKTSTPVSAIAGLPPQVLQTYKRLVQFLHEGHYRDGDKLPSQAELRHLLSRNHYTLSSAMAALTGRGVITRDRRAGTIVRDLAAIGTVPWSVGIASVSSPDTGTVPAFSHLNSRVQAHLHAIDCRCLTYSFQPGRDTRSLSQFGLLPQDLNNQQLDGLIVFSVIDLDEWRQVRDARIPILHAPFWQEAPAGVITDFGDFGQRAVTDAAAAGCRRYAIITVAKELDDPYAAGIRRGIAAAGIADTAVAWYYSRPTLAGGQEVCRQLAALPEDERPDAIIVPDDHLALVFADLHVAAPSRPRISALVHRQLPLSYPFPIVPYTIDLEQLAAQLKEQLAARLLRPTAPERLLHLPAQA